MSSRPNRPNEAVLVTTPIGLKSLGASFDSDAPFTGCRLCGALYQSSLDRTCLTLLRQGALYTVEVPNNEVRWYGTPYATALFDEATDRRRRWSAIHTRRYHNKSEIENHLKTRRAFTPEAAHKLAPFGIVPLHSGYADDEVSDALHTAPRAPANDVESS